MVCDGAYIAHTLHTYHRYLNSILKIQPTFVRMDEIILSHLRYYIYNANLKIEFFRASYQSFQLDKSEWYFTSIGKRWRLFFNSTFEWEKMQESALSTRRKWKEMETSGSRQKPKICFNLLFRGKREMLWKFNVIDLPLFKDFSVNYTECVTDLD